MSVDEGYETTIAVIGLSGCYPGARDLEEFWNNIKNGVESISFFSDEELLAAGEDQTTILHPSAVKARGVLQDIEMFDATFFAINPVEAEVMDPQHRLLLEHSWKALEQAGYCIENYDGSIGVYASLSSYTYLLKNLLGNEKKFGSIFSDAITIGNRSDFAVSRIAYKLHLKGPAVSVQCACSSSLVALHMACQSIWQGECDIAMVGGAFISLPQVACMIYDERGIFSSDGQCRPFEQKSQGTVSGSGVGVVVLKSFAEAVRDHDTIHAIIKGSAINNDSSSRAGFIVPGMEGQMRVIVEAQAVAEVDPASITYIEAHGTGTKLGDPIEVVALTKAFRRTTAAKHFCALGSVKANIGHLDVASGMAGLLKTILALKHKQIPPLLHFEVPNPEIDFANSPFYINKTVTNWPAGATPRRAGVNSFGAGGTNAHVILEEAPPQEEPEPSRPYQLLLLSAKTASTLEMAITNLATYLRRNSTLHLADIAYTLQVGRQAFDYRYVLLCQSEDPVNTIFDSNNVKTTLSGKAMSSEPRVTFLFADHIDQYTNMGLDLYLHEPLFCSVVDQCAQILKSYLEIDLREMFYYHQGKSLPYEYNDLQRMFSRPGLFVIEYALAQVWLSWGVRPQALVGLGVGEYVAACLAEVFPLEEALALVANKAEINSMRFSPAKVPICSGTTGTWLKSEEISSPLYWDHQMQNTTVRVMDALRVASQKVAQIFLEVGPGQISDGLARIQSGIHPPSQLISLPGLHGSPVLDTRSLLIMLGQLWLQGIKVDWSGFSSNETRSRVPLPTHPFIRQRYWIDPPSIAEQTVSD